MLISVGQSDHKRISGYTFCYGQIFEDHYGVISQSPNVKIQVYTNLSITFSNKKCLTWNVSKTVALHPSANNACDHVAIVHFGQLALILSRLQKIFDVRPYLKCAQTSICHFRPLTDLGATRSGIPLRAKDEIRQPNRWQKISSPYFPSNRAPLGLKR